MIPNFTEACSPPLSQVRVRVRHPCTPLTERVFRPATMKDRYTGRYELNVVEAANLIKILWGLEKPQLVISVSPRYKSLSLVQQTSLRAVSQGH